MAEKIRYLALSVVYEGREVGIISPYSAEELGLRRELLKLHNEGLVKIVEDSTDSIKADDAIAHLPYHPVFLDRIFGLKRN